MGDTTRHDQEGWVDSEEAEMAEEDRRSESSLQDDEVDVAIIGGSVSGLATALAALQADRSLRVKVYETRRESTRKCGGAVRLEPNGVKAAAAISAELHRRVVAHGASEERVLLHDTDAGGAISWCQRAAREDALHFYGAQPVVLGWAELEAALLQLLPPGTVQYGVYVTRFEDAGDAVAISLQRHQVPTTEDTATAAEGAADAQRGVEAVDQRRRSPSFDGAPSGAQVRAQLMVATDGPFSHVRQACIDDGPPTFDGTIKWVGRLPGDYVATLPAGTEAWWLRPGQVLVSHPLKGGDLAWEALATVRCLEDHGYTFDEAAKKLRRKEQSPQPRAAGAGAGGANANGPVQDAQVLRDLFSGFPTAVRHILQHTDPGTLLCIPIYVRSPRDLPECMGRGRVVLLGEAAHPLRPTGQEESQALEDAAELGAAMQRYGATKEALRKWEVRRRPRWKLVMQVTMAQGSSTHIPLGLRPGMLDFAASLYTASFTPLGVSRRRRGPLGLLGAAFGRLRGSPRPLAPGARVGGGAAAAAGGAAASGGPWAHGDTSAAAAAAAEMGDEALSAGLDSEPDESSFGYKLGAALGSVRLSRLLMRAAGATLAVYALALAGSPYLQHLRRDKRAGALAGRGGAVGVALRWLAELPAVLPLPEAHDGGDAAAAAVAGRPHQVVHGAAAEGAAEEEGGGAGSAPLRQRVAQGVGGTVLAGAERASKPLVRVATSGVRQRVQQALGVF